MFNVILSATDDLPAVKLSLEHSLVSLSKWESLHEKPFFGRQEKTPEETQSYIECMILDDEYPVDFFNRLTAKQYEQLGAYINSKQSATTFGVEPEQNKGASEMITSELVYFWLVQFKIPFYPTETWHLNRILTLVKIAGIKQSKPKKMDKKQMAEHYRKLNEQRRRESGSAG